MSNTCMILSQYYSCCKGGEREKGHRGGGGGGEVQMFVTIGTIIHNHMGSGDMLLS